jgi:hypothetical protein
MNAQDAAVVRGGANCLKRGNHSLARSADDGRQHGRGAEGAVRRRHPKQRRCGGFGGEQEIATSVDLRIDEAWSKPGTFR